MSVAGWMPGDVGEFTREQARSAGSEPHNLDCISKAVEAGGDFKTYRLDGL